MNYRIYKAVEFPTQNSYVIYGKQSHTQGGTICLNMNKLFFRRHPLNRLLKKKKSEKKSYETVVLCQVVLCKINTHTMSVMGN